MFAVQRWKRRFWIIPQLMSTAHWKSIKYEAGDLLVSRSPKWRFTHSRISIGPFNRSFKLSLDSSANSSIFVKIDL